MIIEINDIIANIKLKPRLLNIFVEGITDECLIKEFLKKQGNFKQVAVRRIDLVKIDSSILEKYSLRQNCNKDKVIALAKCVVEAGVNNNSTIFIVDKDLDDFIGVKHNEMQNVYYTDFPSIESYIFTEDNIDTFFNLTTYQLKESLQTTFKRLCQILHNLFAIRIEHELAGYCLEKHEYKSRCRFNRNEFQFDFENYILDRLKTKKLQSKLNQFKIAIQTRQAEFKADLRNYIHGHDLEEIFYLYVFCNGNRHLTLEQFQSNLRMFFVESEQLSKYTLFNTIKVFAN